MASIMVIEMLKDRQKSILNAVILEHLKTAKPVASKEIVKEWRLGLSPATVRNEMFELDDLGYLEQPHTSAGRTPTDLGYRFFVDHLSGVGILSERDQKTLEEIFDTRDADEFVKELSRTVSHISGTFTAAGMFDDSVFYDTGFSEILDEPEFSDTESVKTLGRLADLLDEEVRSIFREFDSEDEQVFIGEENPFEEARNCSMFLSSWRHPKGFSGFLAMVGPRRTNYKKHKAVIKSLKNRA